MSAQFGRWNFDGKPVDALDLDQVRPVLAPYGPDGEGFLRTGEIGILYRAFHTTRQSHNESQPHTLKSGAVLTWDGRLDNREELASRLRGELSAASSDLEVVSSAYETWGCECFSRLIGDWALSLWDPGPHTLLLAKDFIGNRHLYYTFAKGGITWCTVLAPLVLFAGRSFALEQEYIAGWLSFFPAPHLTPYVGIHSVPAASFVRLAKGAHQRRRYWDFDPAKRIRYRSDAEYEEHFRQVFAQSIRRRLRSEGPILAELSGGMDSSSIVCTADDIIARGVDAPRLDTLSYYDDSEPNWNERPYFRKVEERRGRVGHHIDVGSPASFQIALEEPGFAVTPGSGNRRSPARERFSDCMTSQGYRVLLSGIGGDEVTGGVPTPICELADLLVGGRFRALTSRLAAWALDRRQPWVHLLSEVLRGFLPVSLSRTSGRMKSPPWLQRKFERSFSSALRGYPKAWTLIGGFPSFQENLSALEGLRRELSCDAPCPFPLYERRLPYLDRDLLEVLFAIPREQLVRPGQRRSLLRRALAEVVPQEILHRRRKAFVARSPLAAVLAEAPALIEMSQHMTSAALGIVEPLRFAAALEEARQGQLVPTVFLARTVAVEGWLRGALKRQILSGKLPDAEEKSGTATRSCHQSQLRTHHTERR